MEIQVTAKSVYGETKFYPSNKAAECLASIAGTKTLTINAMLKARDMGCKIVIDGTKTMNDMILDNIRAIA